jgi:hypothetical protein
MTMPFALMLLILAAADYVPSKLTKDGCGSHCSQCWQIAGSITDIFCAECETGYFFDIDYISGTALNKTVCKSPADYNAGKLINGFKRACANCGLHNYLDKDFNCKPCPLGCEYCNSNPNGICDSCYKGTGIYDLYDVSSGSCTCTKGGAEVVDGICHCNSGDAYINKTSYECINCTKCTRDQAKCKASPFSAIPTHQFDDDDKDCPQKCHISCDECNGPTTTDCNRTTSGLLMCRNDLLWEEVKVASGAAPLNECYCVCSSKIDYTEADPKCVCEAPRVKADICGKNYLAQHGKAICSEYELKNRNQCLCPTGYTNGFKNASGIIQCTLRKYVAVYDWTHSGMYHVFVEDAFYYHGDYTVKPINNGFYGIWPSGIDAVAYMGSYVYWFFKGNQTIQYTKSNSNNGSVTSGYPKNISDVWKGNSNVTYVDAAIHDAALGKMYLTQGNIAYVYSTSTLLYEKTTTVEALFPNLQSPYTKPDSVMVFGSYYYRFVKGSMNQYYVNGANNGGPTRLVEDYFSYLLPLNFTY